MKAASQASSRNRFPTHRMIAEEAGLSREAVSHILGGKLAHRYNEGTRQKVHEIAAKLNYRPNRTVRLLRHGKSNLIGIVHYNSSAETGRKTALHLPQAVNAAGYDYLVIDLQWMGGDMERVFNELVQARVEGVVLLAYAEIGFTEIHLDILHKAGIPVISIYGDGGLNIPLVCGNAERTMGLLTRHLWQAGHRKIIQPIEDGSHRNTRERIAGFSMEAAQSGARHYLLDQCDFFRQWPDLSGEDAPIAITVRFDFKRHNYNFVEANYRFCMELFQKYPLPDAILGYNDRSAFGVFTAAWELGLDIPHDVAVTGNDDDEFGKYPIFQLTTARPEIKKTCDIAVDLLLKSLRGERMENVRHVIDSSLVLRSSCGASAKTTVS